MNTGNILPELKQIVGSMLFGARHPVAMSDVKRVLKEVADDHTGAIKDFGKVTDAQIKEAILEVQETLDKSKVGLQISEVAQGFRMENNEYCGLWLRYLLDKGRPQRLSKPSLETLAVIAYRQPCTRAEIEAVRGVAVDQIVRNLMDMQLIRVVGKSELPGRPWQFGTTQVFLEHFGINDVQDLPGIEELKRIEEKNRATLATSSKQEEEEQLELESQDS